MPVYVITTSNPEHIYQLAKQGWTVHVLRVATSVADIKGYAHPAMRIQYSVQSDLTTSWSFSEIKTADPQGVVRFDGTLLKRLADEGLPVEMSTISGSL